MNERKNRVCKPPALPKWLATRYIDDTYLEEFFGDLQEIYEERMLLKGPFHAKLMYWVDVLHLLIGFSRLRKQIKTQNNNGMMIRSMFKIAWRNAMRQKQFTLLNMLGLTLGIATSLVIGLYVYDELTYDTFHTYGDRIYRVNQPAIWGDWEQQYASTGPNVAIALREDAPEFEQVTRILDLGPQAVRINDPGASSRLSREKGYYAVDENFFDVFDLEFIQGDPKTCLDDPGSIVITRETALRYFGYENPVGKMVETQQRDGSWKVFTVSAVLADLPYKSHLQFDILVSLQGFSEVLKANEWKWIWTGFSTYGLVREGTDVEALTRKIQAIPPKWAAATTQRIFNQSFEAYTRGKPWTLYLQPVSDIYKSSSPDSHRFGPTGKPQFVRLFAVVGAFVLILSCINFMNLSTARSSSRAKEVGVRKVLGSARRDLVKQFTFESILFVLAGTSCAMVVVHLILNGFNTLAEKQVVLVPYLINPVFIGVVLVFIAFLGVMAGSYPAFYLSSFKPAETLKGKTRQGFKGVRNGLVIFQFAISIALVICAFFVQKQLEYASSLDLGMVRENLLQVHNIQLLGDDAEILKTKLRANPAFAGVGRSYDLPPNVWDGDRYKAFGPGSPIVDLSNFRAEGDYLDLLGVEFVAGRNFDPGRINDKYRIILNEEAVRVLGFGIQGTYAMDSVIGKFVVQAFDKEEKLEVVGVVKDFNFSSVKEKIGPLMIVHNENDLFWNYRVGRSYLSIRLQPGAVKTPGDLQALIDGVKHEMAQLDESIIFEYSFMDQAFEKTFRAEQRMGTILNLFTVMAMVIACLGLFGLAAFSAEQRTRELGTRKVLGAKVSELVITFSSEFIRLVGIAILLASPIAYFAVNAWLDDFAYRTPIDAWVFGVVGLGALVIALITVGYQSFSAAIRNPVETLKEE